MAGGGAFRFWPRAPSAVGPMERPAQLSIRYLAFSPKEKLPHLEIASAHCGNHGPDRAKQSKGLGEIAKSSHLLQIEAKAVLPRARRYRVFPDTALIGIDDWIPSHWRRLGTQARI